MTCGIEINLGVMSSCEVTMNHKCAWCQRSMKGVPFSTKISLNTGTFSKISKILWTPKNFEKWSCILRRFLKKGYLFDPENWVWVWRLEQHASFQTKSEYPLPMVYMFHTLSKKLQTLINQYIYCIPASAINSMSLLLSRQDQPCFMNWSR